MSTSIQLQKSSVARQLFDFLRHEDFLCRKLLLRISKCIVQK